MASFNYLTFITLVVLLVLNCAYGKESDSVYSETIKSNFFEKLRRNNGQANTQFRPHVIENNNRSYAEGDETGRSIINVQRSRIGSVSYIIHPDNMSPPRFRQMIETVSPYNVTESKAKQYFKMSVNNDSSGDVNEQIEITHDKEPSLDIVEISPETVQNKTVSINKDNKLYFKNPLDHEILESASLKKESFDKLTETDNQIINHISRMLRRLNSTYASNRTAVRFDSLGNNNSKIIKNGESDEYFQQIPAFQTPRYDDGGPSAYDEVKHFLIDLATSQRVTNIFLKDLITNFNSLDKQGLKLLINLLIKPIMKAKEDKEKITKIDDTSEKTSGFHGEDLTPNIHLRRKEHLNIRHPLSRPLRIKNEHYARNDLRMITVPPPVNEFVVRSSLKENNPDGHFYKFAEDRLGIPNHSQLPPNLRIGLEIPPPEALDALPKGSVLIPPSAVIGGKPKIPILPTNQQNAKIAPGSLSDILPNFSLFGEQDLDRKDTPEKSKGISSFFSSLFGTRQKKPERKTRYRPIKPIIRHSYYSNNKFPTNYPPSRPPPPVYKTRTDYINSHFKRRPLNRPTERRKDQKGELLRSANLPQTIVVENYPENINDQHPIPVPIVVSPPAVRYFPSPRVESLNLSNLKRKSKFTPIKESFEFLEPQTYIDESSELPISDEQFFDENPVEIYNVAEEEQNVTLTEKDSDYHTIGEYDYIIDNSEPENFNYYEDHNSTSDDLQYDATYDNADDNNYYYDSDYDYIYEDISPDEKINKMLYSLRRKEKEIIPDNNESRNSESHIISKNSDDSDNYRRNPFFQRELSTESFAQPRDPYPYKEPVEIPEGTVIPAEDYKRALEKKRRTYVRPPLRSIKQGHGTHDSTYFQRPVLVDGGKHDINYYPALVNHETSSNSNFKNKIKMVPLSPGRTKENDIESNLNNSSIFKKRNYLANEDIYNNETEKNYMAYVLIGTCTGLALLSIVGVVVIVHFRKTCASRQIRTKSNTLRGRNSGNISQIDPDGTEGKTGHKLGSWFTGRNQQLGTGKLRSNMSLPDVKDVTKDKCLGKTNSTRDLLSVSSCSSENSTPNQLKRDISRRASKINDESRSWLHDDFTVSSDKNEDSKMDRTERNSRRVFPSSSGEGSRNKSTSSYHYSGEIDRQKLVKIPGNSSDSINTGPGTQQSYPETYFESQEFDGLTTEDSKYPTDSEYESTQAPFSEAEFPMKYQNGDREFKNTKHSFISMDSQELGENLSRDLKIFQSNELSKSIKQRQFDSKRSVSRLSNGNESAQSEIFRQFDSILRKHTHPSSEGMPLKKSSSKVNTPISSKCDGAKKISGSGPIMPPKYSPTQPPPRPPKPSRLSPDSIEDSPKIQRTRAPSPDEAASGSSDDDRLI